MAGAAHRLSLCVAAAHLRAHGTDLESFGLRLRFAQEPTRCKLKGYASALSPQVLMVEAGRRLWLGLRAACGWGCAPLVAWPALRLWLGLRAACDWGRAALVSTWPQMQTYFKC